MISHLAGLGRRRAVRAVIVATLVGLTLPAVVSAHAELIASTPEDGSTVTTAPPEIVLVYDEDLSDGSSAALKDASGAVKGTATIDPVDRTRMTMPWPADLEAGDYVIEWTSIAADGDVERDTVSFTYAPPAPTPSPSPTPTEAPSASPSPTPTEAPSPSPTEAPSPSASPTPEDAPAGSSGLEIILPIVIALLVVGVLAVVLLRGRSPSSPS